MVRGASGGHIPAFFILVPFPRHWPGLEVGQVEKRQREPGKKVASLLSHHSLQAALLFTPEGPALSSPCTSSPANSPLPPCTGKPCPSRRSPPAERAASLSLPHPGCSGHCQSALLRPGETMQLRLGRKPMWPGLESSQNPVFQLRSHTWFQDLVKALYVPSQKEYSERQS